MAAIPAYAATPVAWCGLVPGTADSSNTAPTHVTSLGTAGSGGTKIVEINVTPVGTVVAGIVNVFLYDSTTYHLFEPVTITAATISTTGAPVKQVYTYDNLVLPSNSWSLAVSTTVSGNVSLIKVVAIGSSL
jgi:hypothetical protein